MSTIIDNKFNIGQLVYLKTDPDHLARVVCRFTVAPTGITYALNCGSLESFHFDFEITEDKTELINE